MAGIANVEKSSELGGGARFWAYISPNNETKKAVTEWSVTIEQKESKWSGTITSKNPTQTLQTPKLSGVFSVTVVASGPELPETTLTPLPDSKADIGCNANCAAMVGIVAKDGGQAANYWTTWDARCQ